MSIDRFLLIVVIFIFFSCKKIEKASLPVARFYVEIDSCVNGKCYVHFFDNSDNSVKWKWDFDNGLFAEIKNSESIFNQNENYDIVLIVENVDGEMAKKIKNISF